MKNLRRISPLLLVATLAFSCTSLHTVAVGIPVEQQNATKQKMLVRLDIPADWRPMSPSESRIELLGPDRSRLYVRAIPVEGSPNRCPALAKQSAEDAISSWGGPPRTKTVEKSFSSDKTEVGIELRRIDPKPMGEIIWYRVLCREGVVALASCTVLTPKEREYKSICRKVLDSIDVIPWNR